MEVSLHPTNIEGFLVLNMDMATRKSTLCCINPSIESELFRQHNLGRGAGTHTMKLVNHIDCALGMYSSVLVDTSRHAFSGESSISLCRLFMLSRGHTWYGEHGYTPTNNDIFAKKLHACRTGKFNEQDAIILTNTLHMSQEIIQNLLVGDLFNIVEKWYFSRKITGAEVNVAMNTIDVHLYSDCTYTKSYTSQYKRRRRLCRRL